MALGDVGSTRPRSGAKALGFAKISARPRHSKGGRRGNFPAELAKIRARLPKGVEIELWWQDEARIGQKNKLTRRWARRGTRPRAPRDQRTEWAYIFGAICPAKGKGAGLVMPWCDTDAMAAHLIEISAAVDPGAHAVENIWQYLRQNWLNRWYNRVFEDYDAIIEAGCQAWNKLIDQPETIMSIGMRDWAISGQ